jgi:RNA polymerase sigma factor (sigma-70 family)
MDNRVVEEAIRQQLARLATPEHWDEAHKYAMQLTKGNRAEADDLVQGAFLQTQLFLQKHPEKEIKHPDRWLQKAVWRRFLNSKRGKLRNATTSLDLLQTNRTTEDDLNPIELPGSSNDEPEHVLENQEEEEEEYKQKVIKRDAIMALALDNKVKKVALLRIVEGLTYQEIALICRISPARAGQHVQSCLDELARIQAEH